MSSAAATAGLVPVIGLEVHCQLATRSKLFCPCAAEFGASPNTRTCPVCCGLPGALPVTNARALELALRAALALGSEVAAESRWERKHYFYCDLPKGYQISQFARPLALGGGLELAGGKRVRLRRLHLEEDAGKAIHDRGTRTLVDLNRAGVPLIEIVSEPDLASAAEASEYLQLLRQTLRFAGVSDCDMEKGSLRCDVNVSLHRAGDALGTRVEVKNLNSFKHVSAAIEHEIERQGARLAAGEAVEQETRLFDPERGETRVMRTKEDAQDYRYLPDPDLPPLLVSPADIEGVRAALPEGPAERRARWRSELGLSEQDAAVLSSSRALADFFEETVRLSGAAKEAANWIANDVAAALSAAGADSPEELRLTPERLAGMLALRADGTLGRAGAKRLLGAMTERGGAPGALVAELGLAEVRDVRAVEEWCRAAIAAHAKAAADVTAGEDKALGPLVGAVMKASEGRAAPDEVRATLLRMLREERA